jgi:hypothetical protein
MGTFWIVCVQFHEMLLQIPSRSLACLIWRVLVWSLLLCRLLSCFEDVSFKSAV